VFRREEPDEYTGRVLSSSCGLIKDPLGPGDLLKDIGSFSGPDEGLGLAVVVLDIFLDGVDEFSDAAEDTSANALLGEITEEPFHHF